jgi:deoxyribodipyrimidine photolyase
MIQPERLKFLNAAEVRAGDYVLYWMQASQRVECNHAFQYAVRRANVLRLPVVVYFGLTDRFPEANERHYAFLLEGLADVRRRLNKLGVRFVLRRGSPERGAAETDSPGRAAFFEELLVRRELSLNFVHYNPAYDAFRGLPPWARKTLAAHASDPRPALYCCAEFEAARTHDPYWNAAQNEMRITGKMHGYMRMYWGKKLLEWSRTPEEGFAAALRLNDKYELDGRDPNGFAGVAWCFGKHDRPWGQRPVFGLVRSMTDGGLRRKFDADRYVQNIEALTAGRG